MDSSEESSDEQPRNADWRYDGEVPNRIRYPDLSLLVENTDEDLYAPGPSSRGRAPGPSGASGHPPIQEQLEILALEDRHVPGSGEDQQRTRPSRMRLLPEASVPEVRRTLESYQQLPIQIERLRDIQQQVREEDSVRSSQDSDPLSLYRHFPEFFQPRQNSPNSSQVADSPRYNQQVRVRDDAGFDGGGGSASSSDTTLSARSSPEPAVPPLAPNRDQDGRAGNNPALADANLRRRQAYARNLDDVAPPPVNLSRVAFDYHPNVGYSSHRHILIGAMDRVCVHCNAKSFRNEPAGLCCESGKVSIDLFPAPPEPVRSLFDGEYPDSVHFLSRIRRYNSLFQMTSFGVRGGGVINHGGLMPTFKVQGQIYHRMGSLMPAADQARYLQVYFVGDSEAQLDARMNPQVRRNVVRVFQDLLNQNNQHVQFFRTALERMPADEYSIVISADRNPAGDHRGRYSEPTRNEVAIVIVQNPEQRSRDIIIQRRNMRIEHIAETHRFYDAYQYPLILWQGMETYHFNLREVNPGTGQPTNKKLSSMSYYAHQLMIRDNRYNFILKCGQLLNQFVVDMYAKVESERLLYYRTHQEELRVDEYINLADAMRNDEDPIQLGRRFILPSTFIGGPRHMHEYAQDAIAYVRQFGRPDLFITFTCNPEWVEIRRELYPGQSAYDRHDIVARVFNQKVKTLMSLLTTHHVFGTNRCHMYSIEWQKRGLPHVHILLWLMERIRPENIDAIICAELPDPNIDPDLYETIKRNMIHGPCGAANGGDERCRDERGRCSKRFPRPFTAETRHGEDGYPIYRRRSPEDGGGSFVLLRSRTVNGRRQEIRTVVDNRWVVPYSPFLSKSFNAHINIEYCHSVKSIKYICKYVNKGSDMAMIQLRNENINRNDELQMFQLGRYISSNEAFWRIFGFRIHDRKPNVEHLAVHLENGQRVYFRDIDQARAILHANDPPNSTLTAFFHLCRSDPFAQTLYYYQIPTYYRWIKTRKVWQRRVYGRPVDGWPGIRQSDAIGRVYTVHPSQDECFFLRMLLMKVRGPTWFDSLKIHEGIVYQTYRMACIARGLLDSDQHLIRTLEDAALSRDPYRIRELFAVIITACEPSDPESLWESFKDAMSEDFLMRARRAHPNLEINYTEEMYNRALILIEDLCLSMVGKVLIQLGFSHGPRRDHVDPLNFEILREQNYNRNEMNQIVQQQEPLLNAEQRAIYNEIIESIDRQLGGLYFIDAPGGTGKSFLINLILAQIRSRGDIAVATAASGIAATLLMGGRTAHSTFKFPLDIRSGDPVCGVTVTSAKGRMLNRCKVIFYDEVTMADKRYIEALNRLLQDIKNRRNEMMGGVVVVLAGDFRQTLPVIPRGTPADEIDACLKSSVLWRHVKIRRLRVNMRVRLGGAQDAEAFSQTLLDIGNNRIPADPRTLHIRLSNEICRLVDSRDQLIEGVFPNILRNFHNTDWLYERAILAPLNDTVDELNHLIQEKLIGVRSRTYLSRDQTVDPVEAANYPIEYLNSVMVNGVPPHELVLKLGSVIMLLRNLRPPKLCNGTRLVVTGMHNNIIAATIIGGPYRGENVLIPRIPFVPMDMVVEFRRTQFPIKLAFAITINKSQGQSLRVAGLDLTNQCFTHGQLYVACSRVSSPQHLFTMSPDRTAKNIVYYQALL